MQNSSSNRFQGCNVASCNTEFAEVCRLHGARFACSYKIALKRLQSQIGKVAQQRSCRVADWACELQSATLQPWNLSNLGICSLRVLAPCNLESYSVALQASGVQLACRLQLCDSNLLKACNLVTSCNPALTQTLPSAACFRQPHQLCFCFVRAWSSRRSQRKSTTRLALHAVGDSAWLIARLENCKAESRSCRL